MENKESNGLNLELILKKAPSEQVRNEMIVDAVTRGITKDTDYFQQAVQILEQEKKYIILGSLYGKDKESPFYNADKAIECYRTAAEILSFKKDTREKARERRNIRTFRG